MKRHKLTKRITDNVKPVRAEISVNDVTKYFDKLQTTLHGIPPENLINYDEVGYIVLPKEWKITPKRGVVMVM